MDFAIYTPQWSLPLDYRDLWLRSIFVYLALPAFIWDIYGLSIQYTCGFATLKFLWSFVLGEGCVQSQTQFLKTNVFVSWCKFMSWGKVFLTPISPFFWDIFIVSLIWLMIKWHNNDNISFSQLCLSFQIFRPRRGLRTITDAIFENKIWPNGCSCFCQLM